MSQAATRTTLINGFDPAALESAIEGIAQSPEAAQTRWSTRSAWQGGTRVRTQVDGCEIGGERIARRHVIEADEPVELFGTETAANPQELLLAAIGSCMSVAYAEFAVGMGIEIQSLEIELSGRLDLRGPFGLDPDVPSGFPEVACAVHIRADATAEQLDELHRSVQAGSPNYYNITHAVPMNARLVIES
jgi:uncharacterized OsmC-like protein